MTPQSAKRIAFVGLGAMGKPMTQNLLSAGYEVYGFDLSTEALDHLASVGGQKASTVAQAFEGADIVITMLPNGKIVQDAIFGDSAWEKLKPNALVIDMSSSAPNNTRVLAQRLSDRGIGLLDAPVSGGVKRAITATLTIMVGGADDHFAYAEPVLKAMGSTIRRTGSVGTGHAMKAINNFVSGAGVLAAMEAVLLGQAFGLEPETIVDVLNTSTGKNNATDVKMKQFVLSKTFGSGFALGLMAKDIRIAADLSQTLQMDLSTLQLTADRWDAAQKALGTSVDHTQIWDFLERDA